MTPRGQIHRLPIRAFIKSVVVDRVHLLPARVSSSSACSTALSCGSQLPHGSQIKITSSFRLISRRISRSLNVIIRSIPPSKDSQSCPASLYKPATTTLRSFPWWHATRVVIRGNSYRYGAAVTSYAVSAFFSVRSRRLQCVFRVTSHA